MGRAHARQPRGDQHLHRLIKANRDALAASAALQRSIFPLCPAVPFPRDAQAFVSGHSDFPSPSAAGLSPHRCSRGSCEQHFQHICDAQVLSNQACEQLTLRPALVLTSVALIRACIVKAGSRSSALEMNVLMFVFNCQKDMVKRKPVTGNGKRLLCKS